MSISTSELDHYCSFIDSPCNETLLEQDEGKIFLAYPYEDKIRWYISKLCEGMQSRGLKLFPWEKLGNSAGIIFCKICKEILSSRAVVADITYLNQNVLFELGFGIATMKIPVLIKETGRKNRVIDILKDIKHIEYSDIDILTGKLYSAVFEDFPFPCNVPTPEIPAILFVNAEANMPIKRPIFEYLDKFRTQLSYRILVDDSSEMSGHRLVSLLRYIEQSDLIVCHMVGTDYIGFNEINAQVSLLAGYALGKNKRILILQERPSDKMIDLQQVRREYRDRKEALQILDAWLAPVKEKRIGTLRAEKKRKEYVSLHEQFSLSLGHPAAEYDTNLDSYFIQTQEYIEAKRLRRYLFLGRRGSGKTASFLQLYENFADQTRNIVVRIAPSKLQLVNAIEKLYNQVGRVKLTALFEMFWQYIILTEIAIACRNYANESPHAMEYKLFSDIEESLARDANVGSEFDIRFNSMVDEVCDSVIENQPSYVRSYILSSFYKEYLPKLRDAVKRVSEYHPIIVLIDNLDKDWSSSSALSVSALINALLEVMEKVNTNNEFGSCSAVTFLRTDIYKLSSRYDPDFDKRQPLFLRWDSAALKKLICERIARAKNLYDRSEDELWNSTFGAELGRIGNTFNYIIERTMLRPRDILTFCTLIMDQMSRNRQFEIEEQVIYDSEEDYSEYLLKNLRQEYSVGYPDVEDICIAVFLGGQSVVTESSLRKRIADYPDLISDRGISDIVRFCFDTGILGVRYKDKTHFSYEGYDYERISAQARKTGELIFTIHPGLNKVLDIIL